MAAASRARGGNRDDGALNGDPAADIRYKSRALNVNAINAVKAERRADA